MNTLERAPALVKFERVSKRYRGSVIALQDATLRIERSEFVLLTGASGAGKTTVLRLIAGLESATAGEVTVAGENIARLSTPAMAILRRSLGIVPQQRLLLDDRPVIDNVALPAFAAGLSRNGAFERAEAALLKVGLSVDDYAYRPPRSLSGGEQQRVALARAIVNRPALLLADEPAAHLDSAAGSALIRLLSEFVVGGVTVIVAAHRPPSPLPDRARVLTLDRGRLLG